MTEAMRVEDFTSSEEAVVWWQKAVRRQGLNPVAVMSSAIAENWELKKRIRELESERDSDE